MALRRATGTEKNIDSHSILASRGKYFSQPINKKGFSEIYQREIHSPITLVREPSASEFELVI